MIAVCLRNLRADRKDALRAFRNENAAIAELLRHVARRLGRSGLGAMLLALVRAGVSGDDDTDAGHEQQRGHAAAAAERKPGHARERRDEERKQSSEPA